MNQIDDSILHNCSSVSVRWWEAFNNEAKPELIQKVAEEIKTRNCNVEDLFLAFISSRQDNIGESFTYLDYLIYNHAELLPSRNPAGEKEGKLDRLTALYQEFRQTIN